MMWKERRRIAIWLFYVSLINYPAASGGEYNPKGINSLLVLHILICSYQ
jgi:hypothetical protein